MTEETRAVGLIDVKYVVRLRESEASLLREAQKLTAFDLAQRTDFQGVSYTDLHSVRGSLLTLLETRKQVTREMWEDAALHPATVKEV